jgi:adenylosuccinate lyase
MRNFGLVLAHSLLAYKSCLSGLQRIKTNEQKINMDLNNDWGILSEAVQIYLKKEGVKNGYEILKGLTRGEKFDKNAWMKLINKLPLNEKQKEELRRLTPENYIGIIN